ncbi:unnamed protein product [Darwinula stevensoni]|uniref:D-aminoacyl-tRNA deacylase n=1 Tax=Darwinula stevensoni TaxID=69355 RepID=A0A7R8X2Q6_9CRUS|nr:unnamed protein product [Darwinula stevensoni]CAG0883704.1 unnamed protein product [Darwinula stevensoni]
MQMDSELVSAIGRGLCVLVGIKRSDNQSDIEYMVRKVLNTRLFEDDNGKRWNVSVKEKRYEILCVSQFTLYGILKGNRLDFHNAMSGEDSQAFYEKFLAELRSQYDPDLVKDGRFGAYMQVDIVNDGPVTIELESPAKKEELQAAMNGEVVCGIGRGVLVLLGIRKQDTVKDIEKTVRSLLDAAIYEDGEGENFNATVKEKNLPVLVLSQFALYGGLNGNKLQFHESLTGDSAQQLYNDFITTLKKEYDSDQVHVNGEVVCGIGRGVLVLLGIRKQDTVKDMEKIVRSLLDAAIYEDGEGENFNATVKEKNLPVLVLSQFALYGGLNGNKLQFHESLTGDSAQQLYNDFITTLKKEYDSDQVHDGVFGAKREVTVSHEGPHTFYFESKWKCAREGIEDDQTSASCQASTCEHSIAPDTEGRREEGQGSQRGSSEHWSPGLPTNPKAK